MKRSGLARWILAHWEIGASAQIAALGLWLVYPDMLWALVAGSLAMVTITLAARSGSTGKVAVSVLGLAGSGAALHASWQVGRIENQWPEVRETLIQRASLQLETTLSDAVATANALAARGANLGTRSRPEAFALLEGGLAGRSPERGVVVFDESGEPWAWAGSHRLPSTPGTSELRARITPFYVVLEAQRQVNDRVAVGQVLLAADSAIPNRDGTVAARFARATGAQLLFFPPRAAPNQGDVFDYFIPAGQEVGATADTLFSVRAAPPAQGTLKLSVLARGGRRVAVATTATLLFLIAVAGPRLRAVGLAGTAGLFALTPLGSRLGMETFFSPGSYFWSALGSFASSAGALFVVSGIALTAVAGLWPRTVARRPWLLVPAILLAAAVPFLTRALVSGVTPPALGAGSWAWTSWVLAVGTASVALVTVAALLGRLAGTTGTFAWIPWVAGGWGLVAALVGLALWRPHEGWSIWYAALWVPAPVLAACTIGRARMVTAAAIVAGTAACVFIWGAVVRGRLVLAERDAQRFEASADPVTVGLLERFGADLRGGPVPRSEAELYARWRRSVLSRYDLPAVLASWTASGTQTAYVELAELNLPIRLLPMLARSVRGRAEPVIEQLTRVPGVHYVLSVPYDDGSVVTVAVGPQSRVVPPIRVAQFLRGERARPAPYDMVLSAPMQPGVQETIVWRRQGDVVRGEKTLADVPGSDGQLHVEVPLGGTGHLTVRGALLTALTLGVVLVFWMVGEWLAGRLRLFRPQLWRMALGQSYRIRLTLAMGVFFVVPTVAFATWSVGRLNAEVDQTRDLVIRQTLQDVAGTALDLALLAGDAARERLDRLSNRVDADLMLYHEGALLYSSAPVLSQLGLLDPYMPPSVYRQLILNDGLEVTTDHSIGGRRTRVGFRKLGTIGGRSRVLAAPRLVDDTALAQNQTDLLYGLVVATLVGFAAAAWLAARAAQSLARPVRVLRDAAGAVGRGDAVRPFDPNMPAEFVPVASAFERMARDVQSHREALERALTFTSAILRNVATGVVALSPDLEVTTANPRAIELLGVDPSPMEPVDRQTAREWQPFWTWIRRFVQRDLETDAEEFTIGKKRIRAQVAALPGPEGGCVVALDDATELAVAERVLAWGEMARQVAHEIKNPLTPIRLGVQHLQRAHRDQRGDFDDLLDRTGRQILAEIERLDAIARAFSRFGAPPAEAGPLGVVDLAEAARETASLYALDQDTRVEVRAQDGCVGTVRKDEFKEVLVNLVENARNADATDVVIDIGRGARSGALVTVRDNGRGITKEHMIRVFEPHFSTTTSGTGLGLAICKRLVESWGGTITVDSAYGHGTVVRFEVD